MLFLMMALAAQAETSDPQSSPPPEHGTLHFDMQFDTSNYDSYDTDKDGRVSQEEFQVPIEVKFAAAIAPYPAAQAKMGPNWQSKVDDLAGDMFRMLDKNSDGFIARDEVKVSKKPEQ